MVVRLRCLLSRPDIQAENYRFHCLRSPWLYYFHRRHFNSLQRIHQRKLANFRSFVRYRKHNIAVIEWIRLRPRSTVQINVGWISQMGDRFLLLHDYCCLRCGLDKAKYLAIDLRLYRRGSRRRLVLHLIYPFRSSDSLQILPQPALLCTLLRRFGLVRWRRQRTLIQQLRLN